MSYDPFSLPALGRAKTGWRGFGDGLYARVSSRASGDWQAVKLAIIQVHVYDDICREGFAEHRSRERRQPISGTPAIAFAIWRAEN